MVTSNVLQRVAGWLQESLDNGPGGKSEVLDTQSGERLKGHLAMAATDGEKNIEVRYTPQPNPARLLHNVPAETLLKLGIAMISIVLSVNILG